MLAVTLYALTRDEDRDLLVIGLPLQLAGFLHGTITTVMWLPMAAFAIPLGIWLIVTGAPLPPHHLGEPAREETPLHDVA